MTEYPPQSAEPNRGVALHVAELNQITGVALHVAGIPVELCLLAITYSSEDIES